MITENLQHKLLISYVTYGCIVVLHNFTRDICIDRSATDHDDAKHNGAQSWYPWTSIKNGEVLTHENYLPIGQNEYYITYWTNQKGCEKNNLMCKFVL